ncbi:MAG: alpha/beta fold hydrolase [Pseudanabaenaceae cyanobacterium bins.68]|nr:alpha/beta fold hydrolase [Pseudanabaenaceae cyanobacterium bins.68]
MNRTWYWRGWQVRYRFEGGDRGLPPLLLIHGFGAAIGHWRKNQGVLAGDRRVYAIDLLGFGGSSKAAVIYTPTIWVEQLYSFWWEVIGVPTVVVGNSIGAMVGILAAAQYPAMAAGVVGISIPDLSEFEAMVPGFVRPIKRSLEAVVGGILALPLFYLMRRPAVIRWVLRTLVYRDRTQVDEQLVEMIAAPARDQRAATAFSYLNRGMARSTADLKVAIARLNSPLLILWGTQDRVIPPSLAPKLAIAGARLVWLEGAGHCPQDEVPEQVNQEILAWLGSVSLA